MLRSAVRYPSEVLRSFRDTDTERVWQRRHVARLHPDIQRIAQRKLRMLDAAVTLDDLRIPPRNRLEKLHADRAGQYSIRINSQWRICFRWVDGDVEDAEITDYH